MNGLNSIGGPGSNPASGPSSTEAASFEEEFIERSIGTGAAIMQFIGSDIIESVLKDEQAVD